jgi:hypothetical protein
VDNKLERIEDKLDQMLEKQSEMVEVQIRQEADLRHHIYRTDQNEELLAILRDEQAPLKKHVAMVEGAFKLLGMICTVLGLLFGLTKILIDVL